MTTKTTKTKTAFSRRTLLGRIGVGAIAAPFLPLLEREVEAQGVPKRLVIIHSPNGVYGPKWMPTGSETDFTLPSSLQSLAPLKSDMIAFKGLDVKEDCKDGAHPLQCTLLTNEVFPAKTNATSMDQLIAKKIGAGSPFSSLFFASANGMPVTQNLSWINGQANPRPETKPTSALSRIFAGVSPSGAPKPTAGPSDEAVRQLGVRRSVIDHAYKELRALETTGKLSVADKATLDAHLTSLREIEERLAAAPMATETRTSGCAAPAVGTDDNSYPRQVNAFLDIAAASLFCDRSRVVTVTFGSSGPKTYYKFLGGIYRDIEHHAITHGFGVNKSEAAPIDKWQADQVAAFVAKLKAQKEGAGSVLDNTLVLWMNEFGAWTDNQHWRQDIPFVIFGAKWAFKTGRFKNYGREAHGKFITAVAQAFDPSIKFVGTTKFGSSPVTI